MSDHAGHTSRPSWAVVLRAALLLVAATTVVFLPEFFRDPSDTEDAPILTIIWAVALALAAPITAYLVNRRKAVATDLQRTLLLAAPQLPLLLLLMRVDVWLDVRSGYLLAGSGEEAMSYGIGTTIAAVFGLIVVAFVALAARWGASRSKPETPAPAHA